LAACVVSCARDGARDTRDSGSDGTGPTSISTSTPTPTGDGGPSFCRVLRGPIELPLRGPAALSLRGDMLDAVLDDDGRPRVLSFPVGAVTSSVAPTMESLDGGSAAGMTVACAVAGDKMFCPDKAGGVHRATRDGAGDGVIASSRSGSRIAAAILGRTHHALSYLASRRTSEGWVSEAWLAVDDEAPVRVSEDGAGATSVALSVRGSSTLALIVDARAALTAMHVRPVSYDGHLRLGDDEVVFVGGPGERHTAGALAISAKGPAWALLPIGKDVKTFGLAVVQIDDPPRVDEPSFWSIYPNGIDPAPVAAFPGGRTWVVRVRPRSAEPGSPRLLEVGDIDDGGAFAASDTVSVSGPPTYTTIVADGRGGLWIAWVDSSGSWLERLACK
ncbi:MAG: hypothetical protein ACLP1X_14760, partial [Polyangiaceae bacterium]